MKSFFFSLLLLVCSTGLNAQTESEAAYIRVGIGHEGNLQVGEPATLQISVVPKEGWHVYSAKPSEDGAYEPSTLTFEITSAGFEAQGGLGEIGSLHSEYDDIMGGMLHYYKGKVTFTQEIKVTEPQVLAVGSFDYMACNDFKCIPLLAEFKVGVQANK